jgi:hypothetical protein
MRKKLLVVEVLGVVALFAAMSDGVQAQLYHFPESPMTVADCHAGDHWGPSPSHGGLLRCLPNNPPPAPTCPAGQTQTTAPVWNGEAWSAPGCTIANPPPPINPPAHDPVSTAVTNSCGTLGTITVYADRRYLATNPDWSQSFSGTWDQMFSNGADYMNQNYARYYQPMYIAEPPDLTSAVQYLQRVFSVYNPWACAGGVG